MIEYHKSCLYFGFFSEMGKWLELHEVDQAAIIESHSDIFIPSYFRPTGT
jgi:hypothetical protein